MWWRAGAEQQHGREGGSWPLHRGHAEHGQGRQNTTKNSEIPQTVRSPLVYTCYSNGAASSWLGDVGTVSLPCRGRDSRLPAPHGSSLLRHRGTKDEMLCRLLGSYFNSRCNYLKQQLCAQRDAGTDVPKIPSEGEADGHRGLSSAPISVGFCPLCGRRRRMNIPVGLSLALLAFTPRDTATSGAAFSSGKLHQGWRNPLLLLSSTCSVLPMKSRWYHKKIFVNLGEFYSCLKICNIKCHRFLSQLVSTFLCMWGRGPGLLRLLLIPAEIHIKRGKKKFPQLPTPRLSKSSDVPLTWGGDLTSC